MTFVPKPHEIYKHFKGNLYQITAVAEHTETGEQLVIYQAMYGDFKIYARPLAMFTSPVDKAKYPEVTQYFRFELQGPEAERQFMESGVNVASETVVDSEVPEKDIPTVSAALLAAEQETTEADERGEQPPASEESEEGQLDPMLVAYLDADNYADRINILTGLHHRITDSMITTMAIVCDIELGEGDTESRYMELLSCLQTLKKYESNRLH